ncbi:MAG: hypothetical protein HUJ51_02920 [Eggerthellaceae bacterium]|nr:hypothetical protein [Eggerthellaceae bacterium]
MIRYLRWKKDFLNFCVENFSSINILNAGAIKKLNSLPEKSLVVLIEDGDNRSVICTRNEIEQDMDRHYIVACKHLTTKNKSKSYSKIFTVEDESLESTTLLNLVCFGDD